MPVMGKATLSMTGPVTISFFRGLTALIVVYPIARRQGFRMKMLFTKNALFYGLIAFLLNTVVMQVALGWCSANVASILQAAMPICMLVGGVLCLNEKMTLFKGLGAVLATAGIVTTCVGGTLIDENTTIVGILLAATTSITWTIYSVHIKKYDETTPSSVIAMMTFGVGILLTAPFALGEVVFITGMPEFSWEMVFMFFYLGSIVLGAGNISWSAGVAKIDAAISGLLFNLSPVLGMAFAMAAGEQLSLLQFFGCAVVILGISIGFRDEWLVMRKSKNKNAEEKQA